MNTWCLVFLTVLMTITIPSNAFIHLPWLQKSLTVAINGDDSWSNLCGEYHKSTNSIYLFYLKQSFKYNIDDDTLYSFNVSIPENIRCNGQASTIINDIIYIVMHQVVTIASYNITSSSLNPYYTSIPWSNVGGSAYQCLVSINNQYLISVGGGDSNVNDFNKNMRIFNITTDEWILGPNMPYEYSGPGCVLYNEYLYVAGSATYNFQVIKIYVGDMDQILNHEWITLNGTLSTLIFGGRLALYATDIYFVGSEGIVDVIDTSTDIIYQNISQTIHHSESGAVVVAENKMYKFGGRDGSIGVNGKVHNITQYAIFSSTSTLTMEPTQRATIDQTQIISTSDPISIPTTHFRTDTGVMIGNMFVVAIISSVHCYV